MQDETITTNDSEQQPSQNIKHVYCEVGRELLAKPNTLGDLIEVSAGTPTVVYCNTPSDTDFVEIMLKKRGVAAQKLIGNVPQPKLEKAMEGLKSGELSVIVLTDIAARNFDLDLFQLAINYSVPSDADAYMERAGANKSARNLSKLITLITPLDLANFHYVKKDMGFEVEKEESPSADALVSARIKNLKLLCQKDPALQDENLKNLVSQIKSDPNFNDIIPLLVNNTFNVLPALRTAAMKNESMDDQDYSGSSAGRGDRDRNDRGDRDRGDRDRGGDREGRGGRGRGGRDRYDSYSREVNGNTGGRGDREGRSEQGGDYDNFDSYGDSDKGDRRQSRRGGRNNERGPRHNKGDREYDSAPAKKDGRIYIGIGASQNFSKEQLLGVMTDKCGLEDADLKHFSLRENCSFADVPEEKCDLIVSELSKTETKDGDKLYAVKAITINAKSNNQPQEGEGQSEERSEQDYGSDDSLDSDDRQPDFAASEAE